MLSRFVVLLFGLSVVFGRSERLIEKKSRLERTNRGAEKYTVEIIVGVDNEMVEHYGKELNDVVLTALNLTSDVYENSNLKQSISISVLNVMQLPFSASDFEDSPGVDGKNAGEMLTKFCDHMKQTSLEYDATAFITRSKIFTDSDQPYAIAGLAYVGTMCTPRACLILEDSFLTTNWLAAHELGHTFGAEHDDDSACSAFPTDDRPTIMTAVVGNDWNFSPCTQNAIDKLLAGDKSKCLTEEIGPNMLDGLTKNPELLSVSRQCKEWLKERSDPSFTDEANNGDCKKRRCPAKNNMFYTNNGPWANGTPCGENKECQHRECVDA